MAAEYGIPSVDLSDFTGGNQDRKLQFVRDIGRAYEEVGFVSIKNHGIPDDLIKDLYRLSGEFFSMPDEKKGRYEIEGLAGQRGYTSFGKEQAKGFDFPDLKEFFQYGQTVEDGDSIKSEYPDNITVKDVPGFDDTFYKAYRQFEQSAKPILASLSLFLGLSEDYFDRHIHNGNSILRAIHYPPITKEPDSAVRAEQHEDINLITLLVGASAEGLQVMNREGEWVSVAAPPDHIVVNVGDMLQRLTNNRLRSTTHRVINPPKELWHTSRFSIPFFLHPRSDMRLDCLDSCITEDNPLQFSPISAGEYLDERLREIGLKK